MTGWWRRLVKRQPRLTTECAGCGPWCADHGWKTPERTGNPDADFAAAKAFADRVTTYLDGNRATSQAMPHKRGGVS